MVVFKLIKSTLVIMALLPRPPWPQAKIIILFIFDDMTVIKDVEN